MSQTKTLLAVIGGLLVLTYFLVGTKEDGGILTGIVAVADNANGDDRPIAEAAPEAVPAPQDAPVSPPRQSETDFDDGWGEEAGPAQASVAAPTRQAAQSGQYGSVEDIGDYQPARSARPAGGGDRASSPPYNPNHQTEAMDALRDDVHRALDRQGN